MKIQQKVILIISVTLIFGCVTSRNYIGVEPVYPLPHDNLGHHLYESFTVVKSLQPTLKWKELSADGYSYDLAVWKKPSTNNLQHVSIKYNDPEYYVEDIISTEHMIATPLEADTIYMWTVRARKGQKIGAWAVYKESSIYPGGNRDIWNVPFSFKTPEK